MFQTTSFDVKICQKKNLSYEDLMILHVVELLAKKSFKHGHSKHQRHHFGCAHSIFGMQLPSRYADFENGHVI